MAVRKIRKSWWVDFRFGFVRYRKRSPQNTRGGAEAFEFHLRRMLAEGKVITPTSGTIEIVGEKLFEVFSKEWFHAYAVVNNKPSEQRNKRLALKDHLVPYFGKLRLKDISNQRVEAFKAQQLSRNFAPKTINNQLAILRKCLATAEEWGALERMPRIKLLKTQVPKFVFLSSEEADRLLAASEPGLWSAIILVALKTGLRFSELVGLAWEDVYLDRAILCVRQANVRGWIGTTKSSRVRYVPLTTDVIAALKKLSHEHELVFPYQGTWMRYEVGRLHLRKFCLKAGIKPVAWHALRHTFASRLVAAGASLKAVQDLMGHSTINMTMRYSHMNPDNLRDAISLLDVQKPATQEVWATGGQREPTSLEKLFQNISL